MAIVPNYQFAPGPTYGAATELDMFNAAWETPNGLLDNLARQFGGGFEEQNFGIGSVWRFLTTPEARPEQVPTPEDAYQRHPILPTVRKGDQWTGLLPIWEQGVQIRDALRWAKTNIMEESPLLSEEEYKNSAWYRERIPWDERMTEARAQALADYDDRKSVREFYAQKRPISTFLAQFGAQATDPANYIPVAGQAFRVAATARLGVVTGRVATAATDAALNTAILSIATRDFRAEYGDDVTWGTIALDIASAAAIGTVFGSISGVLARRHETRIKNATRRYEDMVKEAQTLGDAAEGLRRGEEVELSETSRAFIQELYDKEGGFEQVDGARYARADNPNAYGTTYAERGRPLDEQEIEELANLRKRAVSGELVKDAETGESYRLTPEERDRLQELTGRENDAEAKVEKPRTPEQEKTKEDFIDWGKSLEQQSEQVQAALRGIEEPKIREALDALFGKRYKAVSGKQIVEAIAKAFDKQPHANAARVLREIGIPGIKRDINGTTHYTVFDSPKTGIQKKSDLNFSKPREAYETDDYADAEKRLGKSEDTKDIMAQHKIESNGEFDEMADVDQLREEGRLTEIDEEELGRAQKEYEDSQAYSEALFAAMRCII